MARMRAIQKVTAPFFAFIDDDVKISPCWFKQVSEEMEANPMIGAVQGELRIVGLGDKWDHAINSTKRWERRFKSGGGAVGQTHNTLIKTELVKDWKPSREDLECWEDYEITQHILKKGYLWLQIPVQSSHTWTWKKLAKNSWWSNKWWKRIEERTFMDKVRRSLVFIRMAFWHLKNRGVRVFLYYSWFRLWCILGLMFA